MEKRLVIKCVHAQRKHRLVFACEVTGNYVLEVCEKCRLEESDDFLVKADMLQ